MSEPNGKNIDGFDAAATAKFIDEKVKYCKESRDALARTFGTLREMDRKVATKLAAEMIQEWGVRIDAHTDVTPETALNAFTNACLTSTKTDEVAKKAMNKGWLW